MVKDKLKYSFIFIFVFSSITAQNNTFIKTEISPKTVYLKQPSLLRISIYTLTWFTKAPNLDNIVIPNAITIRKDRAQSTFENINGKRFTILYFDFFVFPLKDGKIKIPVADVDYSTPPESDYKGVEYIKKTKSINLTVKGAAKNIDTNDWLPADAFTVTEKWSKNLTKLKVGDVVERVITFKAEGTIGALIPGSKNIDIEFGKIYTKMPTLQNKNKNGKLNAVRIERSSILIEKPGVYTFPQQEYLWRQNSLGKVSKRVIKSRKIIIKDNPDLAILKSVQDSLAAIQNMESKEKETTDYLRYLLYVIFISALIFLLYKFINYIRIKLHNYFILKKKLYLNSEKYLFDKMKELSNKNEKVKFYNVFLEWFHEYYPDKNSSIKTVLAGAGETELLYNFLYLEDNLYGDKKTSADLRSLVENIKSFSSRMNKEKITAGNKVVINP